MDLGSAADISFTLEGEFSSRYLECQAYLNRRMYRVMQNGNPMVVVWEQVCIAGFPSIRGSSYITKGKVRGRPGNEGALFSCRFSVEVLALGNPTRARIITTQMLDREDIDTYQLTLIGEDRGVSPLSSSALVTISLLDINDNAPVFSQPSQTFNLLENTINTALMDFNVSKSRC